MWSINSTVVIYIYNNNIIIHTIYVQTPKAWQIIYYQTMRFGFRYIEHQRIEVLYKSVLCVVLLQRPLLPMVVYALHYALATLDKATHPKPLVKTLATDIWTFRYGKNHCYR